MDSTRILTREEVARVLADLKRRGKRRDGPRRNLIVFRLSCCCGLRAKEICGLNLGDIITVEPKPRIRIPKAITKGRPEKRRARIVPLSWDEGTRADLAEWIQYRRDMGAGPGDPVVCSLRKGFVGARIPAPKLIDRLWHTAIGLLGEGRVRQLSVHSGRHTFITHALYGGIPLVNVKEAAGHRNISTTSEYLHLMPEDVKANIFAFPSPVQGAQDE